MIIIRHKTKGAWREICGEAKRSGIEVRTKNTKVGPAPMVAFLGGGRIPRPRERLFHPIDAHWHIVRGEWAGTMWHSSTRTTAGATK